MIVDKRKYSSWQKNYATYGRKFGERCIYSPAFINFFMMLVSDFAGWLFAHSYLVARWYYERNLFFSFFSFLFYLSK